MSPITNNNDSSGVITEGVGTDGYRRQGYKNYVLAVLTVTYIFNFVDRQLISILQESIKLDLGLSDTQLGLLSGFAFAMFYITAGIPIARWADRGNRRSIISLAVGLWSLMTALCGLAMNYTQLFLARVGVGIGEAGSAAPSHSMISDIFPVKNRATAMAVYATGINIGVLCGFLLGGILNEMFGWRVAFVVVGLPGILLAILVRLTVAEPRRGFSEPEKTNTDDPISFFAAVKILAGTRSILHIFAAASFNAFALYGVLNWLAPFFIRTHNMGTGELGIWLAVSIGIFGGLGTFFSGFLADRLGSRDKRWAVWVPALAMLLTIPFIFIIILAEGRYIALWATLIPGFLLSFFVGPCIAVLHSLVDGRMRATTSALLGFSLNIVGLGLGPTIIGMLSDLLADDLGKHSLGYAIIYVVPIACLLAALHFYWASKHLKKDLESVD